MTTTKHWYRCGWCGQFCDDEGNPKTEPSLDWQGDHAIPHTIHINGKCCPYGDGSHIETNEPTEEMLRDAGLI